MDYIKLADTFLYPVITLCIGVISFLLGCANRRMPVSRERLEKVYHPLFLSIEPYLYKKDVTFEDIQPFVKCYQKIEKRHSMLIYPSLRHWMGLICTNKKLRPGDKYRESDWFMICNYVSREYDKLCFNSCIPLRSVAYRLNRNQYSSKAKMYLGYAYLYLLPLIAFIIFVLAYMYFFLRNFF